LLGSHEKDVEFVALGLLKNAKVWTYEDKLFKIGIAISTKQISEELRIE
jgi:predicted nucleic acid-binding protein